MSGIRDGKDLLHNLTTSLVKYVFLPIEGSEPFTAFLQRKHPHFLLRSYFLGVLAVSHYGISLFSDSTRFQQLMAPYSLLLPPTCCLMGCSGCTQPSKLGAEAAEQSPHFPIASGGPIALQIWGVHLQGYCIMATLKAIAEPWE